jgi:hypothetical protein
MFYGSKAQSPEFFESLASNLLIVIYVTRHNIRCSQYRPIQTVFCFSDSDAIPAENLLGRLSAYQRYSRNAGSRKSLVSGLYFPEFKLP